MVANLQALFRKIGRMNSGADLHAEIDKLLHRIVAKVFRKSGEHFWLAFNQDHTRLRRINVPKVLGQVPSKCADSPVHAAKTGRLSASHPDG